MIPNHRILVPLACLAALAGAPLTRADLDVSISADIRLGRALPPPPPEVVVVDPVGPPGPPPWAKTHWYKRSRAYYYYPECDVYYRPADRVWFYLDGGSWRFGTALPASISINLGHAVSLTLETDRPYVYHGQVAAYYPRTYFTRVTIKRPPAADRDHRGPDRRPGPDRGRDNGRHDRGRHDR